MALSYDLDITNVGKVRGAIRGLTAEWKRHNAEVTRSARATRGTDTTARTKRTATHSQEARAHAKRMAQVDKERAAEERTAQQAAAKKERLAQQFHRRQLARFKRETIAKERDAQQEMRRKERAEEALARRRLAKFKAETLRNDRLTLASRQAMLGGAYRGAAAPLAAVGRTAKMAVGLAGSYVVGASVAKHFAAERSAANLANKAFGTPGEMRSREQIKQSLMAQSEAIGATTGNRAGVIEAIDKFVAISGNLPAAQEMAQYMADISDATGADMGDVGRTGGQVMQALMARGVGPEDAIKQTEEILATMAAQAKIGSIEFADLATQMGKVISSTARFDGRVSDLTATMSAMAQLAIAGGASSPEEATTAILRFSDDLVQNAGRYDKMIQQAKARGEIKGKTPTFFTDESKTQLRGPEEIMFDIFRTTKGDLTQVKKLFGIRSMKALEPFQQTFAVFQRAGDQMGGIDAVQGQLDRFKAARMTTSEVRTSAAFAREQTGRKFSIVWEDLQAKVGKELSPAVEELIPAFTELARLLKDAAPYLSAFLRALTKNPLMVGGGLLAGRMGLGAIGGGLGGMTSVPGMAGGGSITGGVVSGALGGGARSGPMPVQVTNAGAMGTTFGGAVMAAGLGTAIGSAVAGAITTWGVMEVERSEARLNDILGLLASEDPKKRREGVKRGGDRLEEIDAWNGGTIIGSVIQGAFGGTAGATAGGAGAVSGPAKWLGGILGSVADPVHGQREMEKKSIQQGMLRAEDAIRTNQAVAQLAGSAEDTIASFGKFKKELEAFSAPKGGNKPNTSDAPSPVKP